MVWPRPRSPPLRGLDEFREAAAVDWHRDGRGRRPDPVFFLSTFAVLRQRFSAGRGLDVGGPQRLMSRENIRRKLHWALVLGLLLLAGAEFLLRGPVRF